MIEIMEILLINPPNNLKDILGSAEGSVAKINGLDRLVVIKLFF